LFKDDALIFKDLKSRKVFIKSKNHQHALTVNFTGFNYLGLWAKENAPYVCIEPWLGCADTANKAVELKNREGIIMLEAGEEFNPFFTIQAT
jgi:galactose mutarotase-like enzyme